MKQLRILKTLINAHPKYIDIELNSDPKLLNQVVRYAINSNVKVILSYHDFQKTPNYDEALELIKEFEDKLISINLDTITEFVFKFVFTAHKFHDNLIPLKICRNFKKKNRKIISFCMGEEGIFSRIICLYTGSFLTYSFISQKIVSGQINIKLLREFYQII